MTDSDANSAGLRHSCDFYPKLHTRCLQHLLEPGKKKKSLKFLLPLFNLEELEVRQIHVCLTEERHKKVMIKIYT